MPSPKILIIVQNLPVPMDRRVWMECLALKAAGYQVSVICPKGPSSSGQEELEGVHIYRYRPAPQAEGVAGYLFEFVYCWLRTAWLSLKVHRERGFQVLQACNPPDTYWALAALWRLRGVRFVYDQHDLNPELYLSRFGPPTGARTTVQYRGLLLLERMTYRLAHRVVVTNASYQAVAIRRGRRPETEVTIVRSGPDTAQMRPVQPYSELLDRAPYLLAYLGIMGPQDGIDVLLESLAELVHRRGRRDVHAVLMGFGDCLEPSKRLARRLGLEPYVTFTGRVGPEEIARHLSSATLGLCPDLQTPLNDVSTMNKTMEYMAYGLPSVSFDLQETRITAGDCALYAPSGDVPAFARAVEQLLDDEALRRRMSVAARRRCVRQLDWAAQARAYVSVFDDLTGHRRVSVPSPADRRRDRTELPTVDGVPVVDLRDPDAFEAYLEAKTPVARPRRPGGPAAERSPAGQQ